MIQETQFNLSRKGFIPTKRNAENALYSIVQLYYGGGVIIGVIAVNSASFFNDEGCYSSHSREKDPLQNLKKN